MICSAVSSWDVGAGLGFTLFTTIQGTKDALGVVESRKASGYRFRSSILALQAPTCCAGVVPTPLCKAEQGGGPGLQKSKEVQLRLPLARSALAFSRAPALAPMSTKAPQDFLVPIGRLIISGPAVLPLAGQRYRCVRMRQCEIENFQGRVSGSLHHAL